MSDWLDASVMRSMSAVLLLGVSPSACDQLVYGSYPPRQRQPFYYEHQSMNRESSAYIYHQSGGMNAEGYFYRPQSSQALWGVRLEDGVHRFPMAWEEGIPTQGAMLYRVQDGQVIGMDFDLGGQPR